MRSLECFATDKVVKSQIMGQYRPNIKGVVFVVYVTSLHLIRATYQKKWATTCATKHMIGY
jgi:hypothetical protein